MAEGQPVSAQQPVPITPPQHEMCVAACDPLEFVKKLIWKFGSLRTATRALNRSFVADVLKGTVRYEKDRWVFGGRFPTPPTGEECKALAQHFTAAGKKLSELSWKFRLGELDEEMRDRLEEYGIVTKGGARGRWMGNGLACEMAEIGTQLV